MPKSQAELDSAPAELPAVDTPRSDDAAKAENVSESVEPDHSLDAPAVPFIARRSHQRLGIESLFVRLIATLGIVGVAVAVAAVLGTQDVRAWVIGLVISLVSVILAAILWSSRTL
jgi:hypothetical protein